MAMPSQDTSRSSENDTSPIIQFTDVSKAFGAQAILRNIHLQVQPGEIIALAGHSGCGKTTLLRCINGLEHIDSGALTVNQQSLRDPHLNWSRFRSHIGMVFQQYNLFPHLSLLKNIVLAPIQVRGLSEKEAKDKAMELLNHVGLADKAHYYPEQLSGGQKQRVAIARSLAMEPDILLMDEPTSALDPPMAQGVLAVIEKIATAQPQGKRMTLIIVSHELRFLARMATRFIFMEQGRIVEEGSPQQVLNNPQSDSVKTYLQSFAHQGLGS